ncbi:DUF2452 domain-containing protein [Flavobacteriales bacterium]|nr:DUF2452 domain-containing protein [Flavobacteriales bacterium]
MNKEERKAFINPIDPDKVAEQPHLLPYAHNVGGVAIKPIDRGKVRSRALMAMEEQTNVQLKQIYEQIEVLAKQAKDIQKRVDISNWIYSSEIGFEPLCGKTYHLYIKEGDTHTLSMIGPNEWGRSCPFEKFVSTVKMMADHTWEIIE